jgi:serine/threonine protein kinase
MDAPLWHDGGSGFAHEREALAFVKERLANHEPFRAWSNVEFIAGDGSINEVDLLVVTPHVFALVEIKSFPGKVFGDGQTWRNVRADGVERLYDHPLLLTNSKAKRLRSLLARQKAFRDSQPPWITPMVFLSAPDLDCRLHDVGRTGVAGRDREPGATPHVGGFAELPGIMAALRDPTLVGAKQTLINKPISKRIADAIDAAGLKPVNRGRKAGDWEIGELLDEGPGWQDFEGTRPNLGARRRVRIYLAGAATTSDEERRLRREAEREVRLLEGLQHEGIAAVKDLVQADRGPAVLLDRVVGEVPLDRWASEHVKGLDLLQRIELVRQLGEALAHAHARRVTHRALTPRSILVRPSINPTALPQLVIGHWQSGSRELATRLTRVEVSATSLGGDLAERLASAEQVYLAPEAYVAEDPDPVLLDVFSLGSIAYLLLTGRPPASDLAGRDAVLAEHHGLPLAASADGFPDDLDVFVQIATSPVPAQREPVTELLRLLDSALDQLTAPIAGDEYEAGGADPLLAHQGDELEGGWKVIRRLGAGSTAVALLCERDGPSDDEVLKVAKDEDYAERLRDEHRALERLTHACLVRTHGLDRMEGRTVLRLDPAGDPADKLGMTLADRLRAQGRLGLDLLERFGDDLLDVVEYLESMGVAHRDIKPDNLGVRPRRGDRSLHLVLFDLSLTKAPDTSLSAGTPGYLDPFLPERKVRRWDPAAERYSAAATLHEMATGVRPKWGDGRTDPIHLPDQLPTLDRELFEPVVQDRIVKFFEKALHRDPEQRFDNAEQMRLAWRAVFAQASRATVTADDEGADEVTLEQLAAAAEYETPVTELGMSGLAVSVLERRGVTTVEQLLRMSALEWNRAVGVGLRVRREVADIVARLRTYLDVDPTDDGDTVASIDRLAALLVPKPQTPQAQADQQPLGLLLGLDAQLPLDAPTVMPAWPSVTEIRAATDLDRAGYDALVERARARWVKQPPITQVRADISQLLERAGGVLPADEIAEALLVPRGSVATGALRTARARAVVRAALEAEAFRSTNRFTWRRIGGGAAAVVALRTDELDAEELADYAGTLGMVADQLAAADPLPSAVATLDRLRAVPTPAGLTPLADFRLARLAAAASANAAVSSRLEIYPRGLPAERAIVLARSALLGSGTLSEDDVRNRVRTRFPLSTPVPHRPQLDRLLDQHLGLIWFEGGTTPSGAIQPPGFWIPPAVGAGMSTVFGASGARYRTGTVTSPDGEERFIADEVHARLTRQAAEGGYLVMTVEPRWQRRAIDLLRGYGPHTVDVDDWLVSAMRDHAGQRKIKWQEAILAADAAGPTGERWTRLTGVAKDSIAPLKDELKSHRHLLFTHPGLLGRYNLLGMFGQLYDLTRQPTADQALRTVWVLVAADDPSVPPNVAGHAVPIPTAAEHLVLPTPWLENLHKTAPGVAS